ncbi:MAG: SGNH/GDSL hydrolase family protein [Spirosomataceae bacterium]
MKWIWSILISLTACSAENSNKMMIEPEIPIEVGTYRYLSLGDSYTIGESVSENDRWSVILTELLRKNNVKMANPEIIARTGWTTAELTEGIKSRNPKGPYSIVSLLIGVNNQYRGQSLPTYRTELRDLLQQCIGFTGGYIDRVFVLSIPDWGVTPFAKGADQAKIATEIDAFNQVAKEECEKLGIVFLDITPISRTALNDTSLIADDGLHFSGKMYRLWAEKALPVVQRLLR